MSGPFLGDGLTRREQSPNFAGTPKQLRFILSNLQVVLEGGLNLFLGKRGEGLLLVMACPLRSYAWAFEAIASGRPASGADDVA